MELIKSTVVYKFPTTVLTNSYKFNGLKQHKLIILQLRRSEVQNE